VLAERPELVEKVDRNAMYSCAPSACPSEASRSINSPKPYPSRCIEAEFVSLFAMARQQGRHHMAVKKELDAAGVKPALDPETVGATFYRRREC
jgi:hypothetical protein